MSRIVLRSIRPSSNQFPCHVAHTHTKICCKPAFKRTPSIIVFRQTGPRTWSQRGDVPPSAAERKTRIGLQTKMGHCIDAWRVSMHGGVSAGGTSGKQSCPTKQDPDIILCADKGQQVRLNGLDSAKPNLRVPDFVSIRHNWRRPSSFAKRYPFSPSPRLTLQL